MLEQRREIVEKHIKTHSARSVEDCDAVTVLNSFLRSDGKINKNFSCNDKWPNIDGTFEFVSNPSISRRPEQNFVVQIKGTHQCNETNGIFKYSLKSLASQLQFIVVKHLIQEFYLLFSTQMNVVPKECFGNICLWIYLTLLILRKIV